jgi:hypothetical protein
MFFFLKNCLEDDAQINHYLKFRPRMFILPCLLKMDSSLYRFLLILFITHLIGNLARVICENIKNKSSSIASQQILTLERASPADTRRYI